LPDRFDAYLNKSTHHSYISKDDEDLIFFTFLSGENEFYTQKELDGIGNIVMVGIKTKTKTHSRFLMRVCSCAIKIVEIFYFIKIGIKLLLRSNR